MAYGRDFSRQVGQRIAARRHEMGIPQAELARILGVSQQNVASYETGRLRIPLDFVVPMAGALHLSVHELLGVQTGLRKPGPEPILQRQLDRLQKLPRRKQKLAFDLLETLIRDTGPSPQPS